jgi:hypothetical protein
LISLIHGSEKQFKNETKTSNKFKNTRGKLGPLGRRVHNRNQVLENHEWVDLEGNLELNFGWAEERSGGRTGWNRWMMTQRAANTLRGCILGHF